MDIDFAFCGACGNTHRSIDDCPNGWVYSHWSTTFISLAQNEKEQIEIRDFHEWFKKETMNSRR